MFVFLFAKSGPYTTSRGLFLILIFPNRGRRPDLLEFQEFGFSVYGTLYFTLVVCKTHFLFL